MRAIVTGADGFIGSWLLPELRREGIQAKAIPGVPNVLDLGPEIAGADLLVHLAALVGRERCELDPRGTAAANAGLTAELAIACRRSGCRMVYVSSSEAANPFGIYGLSKLWGEQAVACYCPDALILRLYMPYGPGHRPGFSRAALTNFLWAAMHGDPLIVHGRTSRSWCWIEDTARAIALAIRESYSLNVGRIDNDTSMYDVAVLACLLTGADPEELIQVVEAPSNVSAIKRPDVGPLYALGWSPRVELREGMERVLEWLRAGCPPVRALALSDAR